MPYFGFFSSNFWKTTVIFEISSLEFALLESFVQKIKIPKFGTKNSDSGAGILKHCCHIWNQPPRICLLTMFDPNKKKSLNLGPKRLIWVLLDWKLKIILLYLKSVPSNLSNCKNLSKKQKCLNLGSKMYYLGILGTNFEKHLSCLKSAPSNFSYCKVLCKK